MQQKMLKYAKKYPKYSIIFYVMLMYYQKSPNGKINQIKNNYFPKL